MPASTSTDALVNVFSNFFSQKIADIRRELDNESGPITTSVSLASPALFRLDTLYIVDYYIQCCHKALQKSSVLDAIPTHLLKEHFSVLAPFLTELIDQSLKQGQCPSMFKLAAIFLQKAMNLILHSTTKGQFKIWPFYPSLLNE